MSIKNRLKKIEEASRVSVDFCRCGDAVIKIFPKEERPEGYTPSLCLNSRRVINTKGCKIVVILPTAD